MTVLKTEVFRLRSQQSDAPRPFLKWAGGKTQLLREITSKIPDRFEKYIEPFFGGGALFFNLQPDQAVISDSNPELINVYKQVQKNVEDVIVSLRKYKNEKQLFLTVRQQSWSSLSPLDAAARTIFLNKTCFNGLYRVNKKGQFNAPFGRYLNPNICDVETLRAASRALRHTKIICGDYKKVLFEQAKPRDLIFIDPPYLPISKYSDFKRYTKEQFYEEDHVELASEIERLHELGCHVILTNSNHPLVHEMYGQYEVEVISTKRFINSNAKERRGEDVLVNIPPRRRIALRVVPEILPSQVGKYPATRFMGSKTKLLTQIWDVASQFEFDTVLDLFSGSGVVGYMFKSQGKTVIANDHMAMSALFSKAMIENNKTHLPKEIARRLLLPAKNNDEFVRSTFKGLYFSDSDNKLIDEIRTNIKRLRNPYYRAIAMSALMRACVKKRPRGIFTFIGDKYDDGRKDLRLSFRDQFLAAVEGINHAVFDNHKINKSNCGDALTIRYRPNLVYMDPPYYSPFSDNEYVRRYHFVEGLARNWEGVEIQQNTQTKKFKSYPTPFSSRKGAIDAFDHLFQKFQDSVLIVSYSSNSLPTLDEMVELMARYKKHVDVVSIEHRYSFGNQGHKADDTKNQVKEYLFVGH